MSAVVPDISRDSASWDALDNAEDLAVRALEAAAERAGVQLRPNVEVSLLLTGDEQMRGINREWRGQDKPTNVLSFPAVQPDKLARAPFLGDIAVAFETTAREAAADGKTLADHFTHLVVHGFLHLLGYDHETEAEAEAMEGLEVRILAALGVDDPYRDAPAARGTGPLDGPPAGAG
ncbi:MAG: rRNA maturation RNase YbeY [Alsobacter sp.]